MKDAEKLRLARVRAYAEALADVAVAYSKLDPAHTHHIANASLCKTMHKLCGKLDNELGP